tara:strand:- start:350 stop:598 length:249 start_codon:yes stop_codon:yes gene_type:complete
MQNKTSLILEYLKKDPIVETKTFRWHATPIGIFASWSISSKESNELILKKALEESKLIALDLTKEEYEYHETNGLRVIIFYS